MTTKFDIRPYKQEDALGILEKHDDKAWALINEAYGVGVTYELDGKVIACAGIRDYGLGEIWAIFSDDAKGIKFSLGKESIKQLHEMMEAKDLWLVIATVDKNTTQAEREFLEFLGFTKTETYTFRRDF